MTSFSATVSNFVLATEQRQNAVFRDAAQTLGQNILDDTPVDFGFLKGTFGANLNQEIPSLDMESPRISVSTESQFSASIANATINDTINMFFTAEYAGYVEEGTENEDGTTRTVGVKMVGLNAQKWEQVVNASVNLLESSIQQPQ